MFQILGKSILDFLDVVGQISLIYLRSIESFFTGKMHAKNFFQQMVRLGYESLPITLVTACAVGMVFAIQITREFSKYGAVKVVGGTIGIALWRELAPVLTAVVVAGRVGAAITAELGSMKVTEQIDALKSMGLSRTHFLVAPRFFALTFAMPLLVVLADVIGLLGAYVIAAANGVNSVAFWESAQSMLQPWDIYGGLIKAVFFATMVAAVACYKGLDTQGGASGVGQATTMSVVISLILIFVSNYFLSNFLF